MSVEKIDPVTFPRIGLVPLHAVVIDRLPDQGLLRKKCHYWQLVPLDSLSELVENGTYNFAPRGRGRETFLCFWNKPHNFNFYHMFVEYIVQKVSLNLFIILNTNNRNPFFRFIKSINHFSYSKASLLDS